MGLLTDPSSDQGKIAKILVKYYGKLCILLYIGGVIWFSSLALPMFNTSTYFSENALLPGLVKSMFWEDRAAMQYLQELQDETQKYDSSIPYPWLLAKFQQIGLDSYTHNFTLHSPLNPNETYYGKNVYGILRAPRASSTESLVLSVPYRPPSSIYATTLPSIAIQLAFAKYAIKEKYWAKDIIFLITDHEQLGMQAWLEAYHGVTCGNADTLKHGTLKGRAGAIQAAINLELHSAKIEQIDLKIEGLNGQLPNLDLFNLAGKICIKEGVLHTFKGKIPQYSKSLYKGWQYNFKNMMKMVSSQATGIPTGNHGLFLRFGIQALTLEGFEQGKYKVISKIGFLSIGRVIEGIFRSMNNLLERFHQSFFFYILPSYDRYISIGLYMPALCMIAATLIIKACAKWCQLQDDSKTVKVGHEISYVKVVLLFFVLHGIGVFVTAFPGLCKSLSYFHFNTEVGTLVSWGLVTILSLALLIPYLTNSIRKCQRSCDLLCIFALLELGTALICISMNNISLGIICSTISVPVALIIDTNLNEHVKIVQKIFWLIVHPASVLFIIVLVNTVLIFNQEPIKELLLRALYATHQAVIYSIVDSMIYGNWLYTVVTSIFVPNWLCFWCVACSAAKTIDGVPAEVSESKKQD
ncbi:glycosylphosphatidylinositol anchor attachment 1 protein [Euwallacea similis]|uniref:glycosylphosphatidylinositol anchor attachment 1 protein n=1 Tax=Euwallacea similis TaxID=1736056 RepID=UPI00344FFBC5